MDLNEKISKPAVPDKSGAAQPAGSAVELDDSELSRVSGGITITKYVDKT
jgi:hypothetical protein